MFDRGLRVEPVLVSAKLSGGRSRSSMLALALAPNQIPSFSNVSYDSKCAGYKDTLQCIAPGGRSPPSMLLALATTQIPR